MAKKQVATTTGSTALTGWADRMKRVAQKQLRIKDLASGGGNWISFKGGVITIDGMSMPSGEIQGVVLDYLHERAYYEDEFDGGKPQSPTCYAYGDEDGGKAAAPHDAAKSKQNDACKGCEWAEYGSADKGKGQACREGIRFPIMLLKDDQLLDSTHFVRVPPTSMKGFTGWVDSCSPNPFFAHVVNIKVVPSATKMFELQFSTARRVTQAEVALIAGRFDSASTEMRAPYPDMEEPAPKQKAKPPKGKVRGKF